MDIDSLCDLLLFSYYYLTNLLVACIHIFRDVWTVIFSHFLRNMIGEYFLLSINVPQ